MPGQVTLRRDAPRSTGQASPWIRRKHVFRAVPGAHPGELVAVVSREGESVGWGTWSEHGEVAVRLVSRGSTAPPEDWLEQRLATALGRREHLKLGDPTTGLREVNAEGDALPGITIDRYGEDRVAAITTAAARALWPRVETWLRAHGEGRGRVLATVPDGAAQREQLEGFETPDARDPLRFVEHGLEFETDPPPAQKTGAYFDQRRNRLRTRELLDSFGGPLLDLGCHIGGFALHAARAGHDVVAFDQSITALAHAESNARRNGLAGIRFVQGNMFRDLDRLEPEPQGFGVIVADPPKVAASKKNLEQARRGMMGLVRRLVPRLRPGGALVLCSCSHNLGLAQLDALVAEADPTAHRIDRWGPDLDHPVAPGHPEGEYLNVGVYRRAP